MPRFTTYDGLLLSYRDLGEGEPLVCLPGGPMADSAYLGDLGGLAEQRRLIILDPRGTGASEPPGEVDAYRVERQAGDVAALLDAVGLDTCDLLAHSAGFALAGTYLAREPERVRRMVLVAPGLRILGHKPTEQDDRAAALLRSGEPWFEQALAAYEAVWQGTATPEQWQATAPFGYRHWDAHAEQYEAANEARINHEAGRIYSASGDQETVRAALRTFDRPALILGGEYDAWPSPRLCAELGALLPNATVQIQSSCVHFPWFDDPSAFTRTVNAFLNAPA